MNNEPVLIIMDGEFLVHCGHPDKFDKDLLASYIQEGYNVQTITLQKFKEVDWKWIWSKDMPVNVKLNSNIEWKYIIPHKPYLKSGDVVFHMRGYVGIIKETDYNQSDEVQVDWVVFFSNSSDTWSKPTIASRTSTSYLSKAIRITKEK
jgi:hypothetical protein